MAGPLDGLRVLAIGGNGPIPFCAMLLADLGADVVRVLRKHTDESAKSPLSEASVDLLARGQASIYLT
jgi:alpha-methylacyl-CoA racemase